MTKEELYRRALQRIFDEITKAEVKGSIALRKSALSAKSIAEVALQEGSLNSQGFSMFEE